MRSKGFTLIELLAVIVILAIIALIATPIILNIIEDTRKQSEEESIKFYAKAIENSLAKYYLNNSGNPTGAYKYLEDGKTLVNKTDSNITLDIEYDGAKVECSIIEINEYGSIFLDNCKVNNVDVEHSYGNTKVTDTTTLNSITINSNKDTPLENYRIYGNSIQDGIPTSTSPGQIKSVGEHTKNLFNINTYGELLDSTKMTYVDISQYEIGDTLTISANTKYLFKIADTSGSTALLQQQTNKFSFTMSQKYKDCGHLYIISTKTYSPETKANLKDKNVQLEYGSEATEYEPYRYRIPVKVSNGTEHITINIDLNEPLRKVGDYADYIDFENKKIVRKVGVQIFDGTEEWVKHATTTNGNAVFRNENLLTPLVGAPISATFMTHFALTDISSTSTWSVGWYRFTYSNNNINGSRIYVSSEKTTANDFKTWLASNKPKIYYPLATPIEEQIELPDISTFKGETIIEVVTSVSPSKFEVTYVK